MDNLKLKVLERMANKENDMDSYLSEIEKKKRERASKLADQINEGDYEMDYLKDKVEYDQKIDSGLTDEERELIAKKALEKKKRENGY